MSETNLIRLDLGCGKNTRKDGGKWFGVDSIAFDGVDLVTDLSTPTWLFKIGVLDIEELKDAIEPVPEDDGQGCQGWRLKDSSVDEVFTSHFVEHLTGAQRIPFFNELYRVLKPGAKATIVCPIWSHERAYGDPTHQWPPVTNWTFFYLDKGWRDVNAPHVGYNCDFGFGIAGTHDPNDQWVAFRNMETKTILMSRNINTTTDIIATLNKK